MKFTLSWLKDHLETSATIAEISEKLTAIGLEVESVTDASESLKAFTVAKIIAAEKHPEADKLQVCRVQSDVGELQIVCGAPNARAGLTVALAKEGAFIPGSNFTIKKTKIRGVESNGMLCSFEELGIAGDSSGIIELPESAKVGEPVADALGLNDPVFDIAITPNRADCLGVRGIARDLAAAGLGTLRHPALVAGSPASLHQTPQQVRGDITVTIETENCQQFIGCHIKGVKNGESPDWLKKRLTAIGLRPISALVDITNYFTYDLARPLHVYDAAKILGNLIIRDAKEGEKLAALNGKDYILGGGMCVIADNQAPLALGGIIGGSESGCSDTTTDVFLEVALFTPAHVAQNGRALAIDSDARYRFERGLDVAFVEVGAKLAVAMIVELCGGVAGELVITGKTPEWKREISFDSKLVETLGGIKISQDEINNILISLGFNQPTTNNYQPPSWCADIEGAADIVEEILRIHGYQHIPTTALPKLSGISKPAAKLIQKRVRAARDYVVNHGFLEVVSWSFTSAAMAQKFGGGKEALSLQNPISADLSDMRPSLLPNLLEAAAKNHKRGFTNLRLAEIGLQFANATPQGQHYAASGIITGENTQHALSGNLFTRKLEAVNVMDAKAEALALLSALGVAKFDITRNTPPWYHPGRSGAITLGGKIILGYFGEIHPQILADLDINTPAAGFEIFLENIPEPRNNGKAKTPLQVSDFQAVARDFAFIVDEAVLAADIEKAIRAAEKQLITSVAIFDVYAGKGVETGKKSVAVNVTLQAPDRTLSESEITAVSNAILASVGKAVGGVLRA